MKKKLKATHGIKGKVTPKTRVYDSFNNFFLVLGLLVFSAVVYIPNGSDKERSLGKNKETTWQLVETRPVLSADRFSWEIAKAYRVAAIIPELIDQQFCYCDCKKNFDHKTLLTCFTDEHGKICRICRNEVLLAYELYKKGISINVIKETIDAKFG